MLLVRRLLTAALLLAGVFAPADHARAALGMPAHVTASLVAAVDAVQPGQPVTVALRLVHEDRWHTYWKNPGTGLPTSIDWKLPAGWTAGEIQWPAPKVLRDSRATVVGNGYEAELFLPVTLTPPADLAPGTTVTLAADADWLMCEDVCIPGRASLTLTLPVTAGPARPDAEWGAKINATVAGLPRADPAWRISASRTDRVIELSITPTGAVGHTPQAPHFFSEDGLVAYDKPQAVRPDGRGGFVLTLDVSSDGPSDATKLIGVVTSANGWLPGGTLAGLVVEADFTAGVATESPVTGVGAEPAGLGVTLLFALIGGLILNLMPCVFPVLGIKILGFVNQAGHQRSKIVAHGLTFTMGVMASFWALAGVLAVLRAGGDQLGWGFQLQSPVFVYVLALVMLVFGMNMSGVFEFGLRATAVGGELQSKSGYTGSFFTGVLATVVATPCSAPFLAPALGAALAVSTVESFAIFTFIALGLSLPYLLLSIFPAAVKVLPRPGAWMETFKQFMAFPLYATAGYLVWVLAAQTSEEGFRGVLFSLVLVAMGIWMYGRWNAPGASAGRARFGVASLLLIGTLGLWVGWPRPLVSAAEAAASGEIVWEPWSTETVTRLRAEGRIIYVDFTARWCATCQTNKKIVFASNEVKTTFADRKIVALRGDWTNQDPLITAELARYQRSAVPFNVIWMPGENEPIILPELLTPGIVLEALNRG